MGLSEEEIMKDIFYGVALGAFYLIIYFLADIDKLLTTIAMKGQ